MRKLLLAPIALALGTTALISNPAHADDLGCQVMLCMAAGPVGGWQTIPECVDVMRRAQRKMAFSSWTPRCQLASPPGTVVPTNMDLVSGRVNPNLGCPAAYAPNPNATGPGDACSNSEGQTTGELINPQPYFMDLVIDGQSQDRVWFGEGDAALAGGDAD